MPRNTRPTLTALGAIYTYRLSGSLLCEYHVAIKYILVCCVLCAETPFILFNLQSYKSGLVSGMYFNCRQMYTSRSVCAQRITSAALLQLCLFQNSMLCCCVLHATRTIRYDKITEILTIHRHIDISDITSSVVDISFILV